MMNSRSIFIVTSIGFIAAVYWLIYQPKQQETASGTTPQHIEAISVTPAPRKPFYPPNEKKPPPFERNLTSQKFSSSKDRLVYISKQIINQSDMESFQNILKDAYQLAPTDRRMRAAYRKSPHHAPSALTDYAIIIGAIEDKVKSTPKLLETAMQFYTDCGRDQQLVYPMRSVCAAKFFDHQVRTGKPVDSKRFSSRISQTAKMLMIESY